MNRNLMVCKEILIFYYQIFSVSPSYIHHLYLYKCIIKQLIKVNNIRFVIHCKNIIKCYYFLFFYFIILFAFMNNLNHWDSNYDAVYIFLVWIK